MARQKQMTVHFTIHHAFWILWLFAFLAHEFYAVGTDARGDTLTETVKAFVATSYWFRLALQGLLVWMVFHFDAISFWKETYAKLFH